MSGWWGSLAEKGYDLVYGARPLKRLIQEDLVDRIAKKLLGALEGSVIQVRAGEGALEIGKARVHCWQRGGGTASPIPLFPAKAGTQPPEL